jgi:hypothetical protein
VGQLIADLGCVPCVLVWDGKSAIGRWRRGRVELTAECHAVGGTLRTDVLVCRPGDPEAEGLVAGPPGQVSSGSRLTDGGMFDRICRHTSRAILLLISERQRG